MAVQDTPLLACCCIPDPRGPVMTRCDNKTTIRAKRGMAHFLRVSHGSDSQMTCCAIPDAGCPITAGGKNVASIRAEACVYYCISMFQGWSYRVSAACAYCRATAAGGQLRICDMRSVALQCRAVTVSEAGILP